jgi:hypothetical protein
MNIDGQCHCGAVKFSATVDPARAHICHCSDCQQLSGTAFRANIPAREEDFHIEGEIRVYIKLGATGNRREQVFCPNCGSQLYATSAEPPGTRILGIRIGTVNQRAQLAPTRHTWCQSALPWLDGLHKLPRHDQAP